jgi:hypothetical protein
VPGVMYKCAATPPLATFLLLCPGFDPFAQLPVPEALPSPKLQLYDTSWKAVVPPVIEESVVPVASKNTNSGEMPETLTAVALSESVPPVPVHELAPAVTGALTATVADCCVLPPGPVQLNVYVVDWLRAPVLCDPLVASVPDQPPEAVHEVAFVADHVSVVLPPLVTLLLAGLRVTVGAALETDTVVDWVADPPVPVQVTVYLVVAVSAAVLNEPLVASLPLQPPDAVQELALVDVQVRVALPPLLTVLGLALRVTVGVGVVTVTVTDCDAEPPLPEQVNVYVSLVLRAPMA